MNCHLPRILCLMLLLMATGHAQAYCIVRAVTHVFVGDMASDPACTFNDLQSAIDDAIPNSSCTSVIHVTSEHTYADQHLTISNRNVELVAWDDGVTCADVLNQCAFFNCPLPPAAKNPLVIISGSDGDSVIHIDGASNVSLLNLTITGGSVEQNGGGIYYDGTGGLTLTSTTVNLNQAGTGGGIYMNGDGGAANLYLNAYSEIIFNTVTGSGGGIFLEGQARLFALYSHTLIGFNHAPQGYGGGIGVIGPARVDIGSTGFNGLPVVYNNSALYGGGISATADSDQDTVIRLFTNDAQAPVQISDNIASATGGAIYLKSFFGFDSSPATSILCAFSFRMEDNIAQEGTAIYADSDFFLGSGVGSYVALNEDTSAKQYCSSPEPLASFGAVSCETGVPCNRISGNVAEDSDGVATLGSTILVQSGGQLAADRIEARANAGAHFLRQVSDDGQSLGDVRLTDCLLAGNALTQELVAKTDGDNDLLLIDSCTFAANQIGAPYAFVGRGTFYLVNSIIDQPGRATIDVPGATVANILSNDVTTLPTTPDIVLGEPTFIDATHGDFHLRPGSLGIDFAPGETLDRKHLLDLDGKTRVVDLPYTPNYIGAMDLGAYEIQLDAIFPCARDDTIFCTGFELTN